MGKNNSINNASGSFAIDPGTSGDSYIQYSINGTGEFCIGVDDDASDAFKLSQGSALGTNDTYILSSAGIATMPLQPGFSAYNNSGTSNVTGDATVATCTFTTELFDTGSDYDGTIFTAPKSGIYVFTAILYVGFNATVSDDIMYFSATSGDYYFHRWSCPAGGAPGVEAFSGSIIIGMTAADTIVVKWQASGHTKSLNIGGTYSTFSGYLLC